MLSKRNYIELVALFVVLVLAAFKIPLFKWLFAYDGFIGYTFLNLLIIVMLIDIVTMIYWRQD